MATREQLRSFTTAPVPALRYQGGKRRKIYGQASRKRCLRRTRSKSRRVQRRDASGGNAPGRSHGVRNGSGAAGGKRLLKPRRMNRNSSNDELPLVVRRCDSPHDPKTTIARTAADSPAYASFHRGAASDQSDRPRQSHRSNPTPHDAHGSARGSESVLADQSPVLPPNHHRQKPNHVRKTPATVPQSQAS